jgi:hypothetical protein
MRFPPNFYITYIDLYVSLGSIDLTTEIYDDLMEDIVSSNSLQVWYRIMLHELLHILGFMSLSFAFWYDSETGLPRSPRPLFHNGGCGYMVPSNATIRISPATSRGPKHYEIATPTVKAIVKAQFNCSNYDYGGRLENSGDCFGSHFDSVSDSNSQFSFITKLSYSCIPLTQIILFDRDGFTPKS